MKQLRADANPTKHFFIENFTRDLSLEDVVLDLIDNSIDSLMRHENIKITSEMLLNGNGQEDRDRRWIEINISKEQFSILDNCGGISTELAEKEVFRFGKLSVEHKSSLGVYGIGMKRAMFKIGKKIEVQSRTKDSGFQVSIDVEDWLKDENNWTFPMKIIGQAKTKQDRGTKINIRELNESIGIRISDPTFINKLSKSIATTYSLFLGRYVDLILNDKEIHPTQIPITKSEEVTPAVQKRTYNSVELELIVGLSDRKNGWVTERAGWYILCNGRVVVNADKTDLTGWGSPGPQYHSKYRGFIGVAFFFADDPTLLPWTTTKRGLNIESSVFQLSRKDMISTATPVIGFLNNMYPSEQEPEVIERDAVEKLKVTNLNELRSKGESIFFANLGKRKRKTTITVGFQAEVSDLEKIKKHIEKPNLSAARVGKYCFEYFLKNEVVV